MNYSNTNKGIKSWAEDDRPREKLLLKGRAALSDAELLAILLGSGSRNESAVDLAKRVLQSVNNNLNELGKLGVPELLPFRGIGEAKAITVITAMELGRRRRQSEAVSKPRICGSSQAYELLHAELADLHHEEFWVIYLSASNAVLSKKCISKGGITATLADVRMILREALHLNSTAIILAHNHPSGNLKPSEADKSLTRKVSQSADIMDIKVLDHIILAANHYYSFADEGLM